MGKKQIAAALCVCMGACLLSGCEKTPEDTIVREKGAGSIQKYENAKAVEGTLKEMVNAPEHYKNEAVYEGGGLVIDTDADVILPDASSVNTYAVSAMEANQELIDRVTNAFFEGDPIYDGVDYHTWTKEDYQERITLLKKYKAQGNLDPYDYGVDDNGNPQFQIDEVIARAEEELKTAPEKVELKEVAPSLTAEEHGIAEKEKGGGGDDFSGVAKAKEGAYDYTISYALKPDIVFHISKIKEDLPDPSEFTFWTEGEYVRNEAYENCISEEEIKSVLNISYEDAKKIAEEKVDRLGLGFSVYGWDYSVFCHGEGGAKKESMLDAGYLFHFSRELDGVPITHTASFGGGLEDMDSTLVPWSYERCDVIVGDEGIEDVYLANPYAIGEIQTKDVSLMDFDSIIKIYEQMMEVSNADIVNYEAERTYHIQKIAFGYSRIYDPTADNETGLLVPVWDFFGGFDAKTKEGDFSSSDSGEYSTRSHMTINAIDGTVIDREIGY